MRTVGHAAGAVEAIRGIHAEQPDVVLLDLRLEEGSGFDVLSATRDLAPAPEIYVLSSFAGGPYRKLAHEPGGDGLLRQDQRLRAHARPGRQRAAHVTH